MSGTRARFSVSLILRRDMTTLWTESYDGDVTDPFAFVDDILPVVSSDLRLQTIQYDGNRLAHLKNSQLSVSELRARAAGLFFKQTLESWEEGYAALDRAVQLSPTDGMSLAMRAQSRLNLSNIKFETLSDAEIAQIGRDLDVAVVESPNSDFVFWARGAYRMRALRDLKAAASDIEYSRQINPTFLGFVDLITQMALLESQPQKAVEALASYVQMTSNDPFRVTRLAFTSRVYLAAGDFAMARLTAREAVDLRPMDRGLQLLKALACQKAGDTRGLSEARSAASRLPKQPSIAVNQLTLPPEMEWINDALHPQADPV